MVLVQKDALLDIDGLTDGPEGCKGGVAAVRTLEPLLDQL